MLRKGIAILLTCVGLAGCAVEVGAPPEEIASRAYVHDGPPSLTLYTVIRKADGSGAHSGLMVNASQRVLFDPAGSFQLPVAPERGDVVYGFTDRVQKVYIDYHARETFDVHEQQILVSPEVAEMALQLVREQGAVAPARCTISISSILSQLPGFDSVNTVWFPQRLMTKFAELPGVTTQVFTDDDADDNHGVLFEERNLLEEFDGL